jgi:hypothetical protein
MLERVVGAPQQALEASDVVQDHRVARVLLERRVMLALGQREPKD